MAIYISTQLRGPRHIRRAWSSSADHGNRRDWTCPGTAEHEALLPRLAGV